MLKFTLGLTTGIALGGCGAIILLIAGVIVLEDSPEFLEALSKRTEG